MRAGGRIRPDGKTEEQWRMILNQARDTLKDPQKRRTHISTLETELISTAESLNREPMSSNTSVHDEMALISAGEFQMGSNDNGTEAHEKPVHTIYIDAFYMDKYPVTNAQYKKFVEANPQWSKPRWFKNRISKRYHDGDYLRHWTEDDYPDGKADYPVNWVSWYAAMAYAQWAGKRLPTEAEWEKAARGGLTRKKYPWGDQIDTTHANYGENIGQTTPIGEYPPNDYGVYDIVGNVWEWCLDEHILDFYAASPRRNPVAGGDITYVLNNFTSLKTYRVLRGGSWMSIPRYVRVAPRFRFTPLHSLNNVGFRCVRSALL